MNSRKLGFAAVVFVMATVFGQTSFAQDEEVQDFLQIRAGTMQAGGVVALSINTMFPDTGSNTTGAMLNIAPTFGYFIVDGLEMLAGINFSTGFGDRYEDTDSSFGFDVGARYIIDIMLAIYPYAGVQFGMVIPITDEDDSDSIIVVQPDTETETPNQLAVTVPAGILVGINAHLALDVGFRIQFMTELDDTGSSYLNIPIGYLGVQGFF
jgi:hypothetical protein